MERVGTWLVRVFRSVVGNRAGYRPGGRVGGGWMDRAKVFYRRGNGYPGEWSVVYCVKYKD